MGFISKRTQTYTPKFYMILFVWNSGKGKTILMGNILAVANFQGNGTVPHGTAVVAHACLSISKSAELHVTKSNLPYIQNLKKSHKVLEEARIGCRLFKCACIINV